MTSRASMIWIWYLTFSWWRWVVTLEHQVVLSYHIRGSSEMISYSFSMLWLRLKTSYLTLDFENWKDNGKDIRGSVLLPFSIFHLQYSTGWLTQTMFTSFLNNPIFQPSQYPVSTFIFTFQQLNKPLTFTILSSQNNSTAT